MRVSRGCRMYVGVCCPVILIERGLLVDEVINAEWRGDGANDRIDWSCLIAEIKINLSDYRNNRKLVAKIFVSFPFSWFKLLMGGLRFFVQSYISMKTIEEVIQNIKFLVLGDCCEREAPIFKIVTDSILKQNVFTSDWFYDCTKL